MAGKPIGSNSAQRALRLPSPGRRPGRRFVFFLL